MPTPINTIGGKAKTQDEGQTLSKCTGIIDNLEVNKTEKKDKPIDDYPKAKGQTNCCQPIDNTEDHFKTHFYKTFKYQIKFNLGPQ